MNIKCTWHVFQSSAWEIENALKSATLYSISLFVCGVQWHSKFWGKILHWQPRATRKPHWFFNIYQNKSSNTSILGVLFLRILRVIQIDMINFVVKISTCSYWQSRDMHQHLDMYSMKTICTNKRKAQKKNWASMYITSIIYRVHTIINTIGKLKHKYTEINCDINNQTKCYNKKS